MAKRQREDLPTAQDFYRLISKGQEALSADPPQIHTAQEVFQALTQMIARIER